MFQKTINTVGTFIATQLNMQKFLFLLIILSVSSCGIFAKKNDSTNLKPKEPSLAKASIVLEKAKSYIGTPYKMGGTTSTGMDCSGLIFNSFNAVNINLPRISKDQATKGVQVSLSKVTKGDLLFFNTLGSGISHVAIVEKVVNNDIYFIHASSSKGVTISLMDNNYWKSKFVTARRIL